MYCDIRGNIFSFLNKSLHETLLLQLIIILTILFCILNIFILYGEVLVFALNRHYPHPTGPNEVLLFSHPQVLSVQSPC